MDINDFFRSVDSKTLAESIKKAKAFADTPEGRETIRKIKAGDNVGGVDKAQIESILKQNPGLLDLLK